MKSTKSPPVAKPPRFGCLPRRRAACDLLPLVEGTTVSTKYGMVKTDHIPFIGLAPSICPSRLIWCPSCKAASRSALSCAALSVDDFVEILTNTDACLTRQYQAFLLATEGTELAFTDAGIRRMAEDCLAGEREDGKHRRPSSAHGDGETAEELSFAARSEQVAIDDAYVDSKLAFAGAARRLGALRAVNRPPSI